MCFSLLFSLQQHSAPPFCIYFLSSHLKVNYLWIVKDYRRTTAGSLISPPCCYRNDTRTYPQITWITNRFLFCCRSLALSSLSSPHPSFLHKAHLPKSWFFIPGHSASFGWPCLLLIYLWMRAIRDSPRVPESMAQVEWAALILWIWVFTEACEGAELTVGGSTRQSMCLNEPHDPNTLSTGDKIVRSTPARRPPSPAFHARRQTRTLGVSGLGWS